MAHDVFISYSSGDKAVADSMCATLESKNIRCWIAPRDVPPGQTWPVALVEAIGNARVFVLILSNGSNSSTQVLREVGEALDKGIPVIPFRIEDVIPSREMGYYLRGIHWLDAMTPPLARHLKSLATTLKALLLAQEAERPPSGTSPIKSLQEELAGTTPRPSRRARLPLLILLIGAVGLVLGVVIYLAAGGKINCLSSPTPAVATTALSKYPGETLAAIQAALENEQAQADRRVTSPSAPDVSSPPGSQTPTVTIGHDWIKVNSFPAPGNAPTGLVRIDDILWIIVPCDNRIYQLDLDGTFVKELEMPKPGCSGSGGIGLTWDGTSLWGNWGKEVVQIDPDTGLAISEFSSNLDGRSIAWDGSNLWVASDTGSLSVYDQKGELKEHRAIPVLMLSGITWANGELWELDEWGTLTRFDQDLLEIESFSLSAECGISSFHQQMAFGLFWDGTSLWVADAVNDRIYQCAPGN